MLIAKENHVPKQVLMILATLYGDQTKSASNVKADFLSSQKPLAAS